MKRIQIERKSQVSQADIMREHLRGPGKPVIITDATENWPARSRWTFEFFKAAYGPDLVKAWFGIGGSPGPVKVTTLAAYINYLDAPLEELPGIWTNQHGEPAQPTPRRKGSPFYLFSWPGFQGHPELYDDIQPAPYFVQDLVSELTPALRGLLEWTSKTAYTSVLIGAEGSLSSLHPDYWSTHAYLAQIRGRKHAVLFSPENLDFLYGGQVDPEQPDFNRFPLFDCATAFECVMEPGDTLLIPANWLHHVRGLEKSITVSHNFFDDSNLSQHMMHVLRNLPRLAKGIDNSPNWREELGIHWSLSDFSTAD